MPLSKEVLDEDFRVHDDTERKIRRMRAASSRAKRTEETGNQSTPVDSGRPRRRATRKTHLQNGDFFLFDDHTDVEDPFDSNFEEHEAMQISDDSHGHANIRSSSRPRGRPRRPRDAEYHFEYKKMGNLSDNETESLKVISQKKHKACHKGNNLLQTMARQKRRKVYEEDEDFKVRSYLRKQCEQRNATVNERPRRQLCRNMTGQKALSLLRS